MHLNQIRYSFLFEIGLKNLGHYDYIKDIDENDRKFKWIVLRRFSIINLRTDSLIPFEEWTEKEFTWRWHLDTA